VSDLGSGRSSLHGAFHDWLHHKQFVLADEITGSDKRADAERSVSLARDG
jgi:hypothetical protein